MLINYLENSFKKQQLSSSILISSNDIYTTFSLVYDFIKQSILPEISLAHHPDFLFVSNQELVINNDKIGQDIDNQEITITQARTVREFLYKTPAISRYKVVCIYAADMMNLNAANAILKILEDTPINSYIFLITERPLSLLSTIRSRCIKLHDKNANSSNINATNSEYSEFIKLLLNNNNKLLELRLWDIVSKENAATQQKLLHNHASFLLVLINRFTKKLSGVPINLSEDELALLKCFNVTSPLTFIALFDKINNFIEDIVSYDLHVRSTHVILMNPNIWHKYTEPISKI